MSVSWLAHCRDCVDGTLVKRFDDQAERNAWSQQHFIITGHKVFHTLHINQPPTEYPE